MPVDPIVIAALLVVIYFVFKYTPGLQVRSLFTFLLLGLIGFFLIITVVEMPPFGEPDNPVHNQIPEHYLQEGPGDTGVVNIASGIINDYRAFDTLGEATVLFVAIAAVIATIRSH